jgi:hypothetical protein
MFTASKDFGLNDDEAWSAVDETMLALGDEATLGEYLDELATALAVRVLAAQRRRLAGAGEPRFSRAR